jgi:O6-methylguanine-DNA--protein-cysteine methyltransferase
VSTSLVSYTRQSEYLSKQTRYWTDLPASLEVIGFQRRRTSWWTRQCGEMVNSIEIAWPTYDPSAARATAAAISSNIVAKRKPAGGSGPI